LSVACAKNPGSRAGAGDCVSLTRIELARKLKVAPLRIITISAYLRENVHYTFSGFNFMAAFLDLLLEVGVERIMSSADYPYASMVDDELKAPLE
jgi:hypothetical protein